MIQMPRCVVYGSVVWLSKCEIELLDPYEGVDSSDPTSGEGVYRRDCVTAVVDGEEEECIAYLKNDLAWIRQPSDAYLRACKQNIEQFWKQKGGVTITVRKGDGTVVREWADPEKDAGSSANICDEDVVDEESAVSACAPAQGVEAIFAYGTLRADLTADGDRWGVTTIPGCRWDSGRTSGFALHQRAGLFYPFVVVADTPSTVCGTILRWPGNKETFKLALKECDCIESFDHQSPDDGLYKRTVVTVELATSEQVQAYMYYQDTPKDIAACASFPSGDWLADKHQDARSPTKTNDGAGASTSSN